MLSKTPPHSVLLARLQQSVQQYKCVSQHNMMLSVVKTLPRRTLIIAVESYGRGRLSTVDLHVLTSLDQLFFILKI
jgi:hypothetical protein